MEDKQMQKLHALKDYFWDRFSVTGNVHDYGKYKGTLQVIAEREKQRGSQPEMQ